MTEHGHPSPGPGDSAGQPWKGRHFESHGSENDDGSAPEELIAAIQRFRDDRDNDGASQSDVVDALRGVRLLVPLVAHAGDEGVTDAGLRVDKTQELSLVTVSGPDGRRVLPAFTSVEALAVWNPTARPIPVAARRAALAAAAEDTELIVIDPGSPTEFALRRPAVWAIAQDLPWQAPTADPAVAAAFERSISGEPAIAAFRLVAGDPDARLSGRELVVLLALLPGLDQAALGALVGRLQDAWAQDATIAERVDSLGVKLTAVS
ncbi:SseB family protein [Herbiconiux sp. CPCC 205763]|uniref:SseB family protein n=1 Tax=Herbiconiux aconitum TaxID=2970913 RepID=A0ABT2GXF7_9MICO|nr:SseB family protein [Herbiconiux aconitum]MCS5720257.1 SseB family protein [Herbiconiux aconitum]